MSSLCLHIQSWEEELQSNGVQGIIHSAVQYVNNKQNVSQADKHILLE